MSASDKMILSSLAKMVPTSSLWPIETNTFKPYFDSLGNFSGTAKCDPNPGLGCAVISSGPNGMFIQMGTGANVPALGNHNHDTVYVKLAGSTMSGPLVLWADPTTAQQAATKNYADNALRYILSGMPDIPNFSHTANSPPTTTDFNNLVDKVNAILGLIRTLGLP